MDPLFGSAWESRVEVKSYENMSQNLPQYERNIDHFEQFEEMLDSNFRIVQKRNEKDGHRLFRLKVESQISAEMEVSLFFYNFKKLSGKLISRNPNFNYKLSSIYKLPLSQYQGTSLIFHRLFNVLQSENHFISIQFSQAEARLVIQVSKYESDILNLSLGEPRLSGTYWKPIIVEKTEIEAQKQLNFIIFLEKIINELKKLETKAFIPLQFTNQKQFSTNLFNLLKNPLNFIELNRFQELNFSIYEYLSQKKKASSRRNQAAGDIQFQYVQNIDQTAEFEIIIYFYDFNEIKGIFSQSSLLFSLEEVKIFKKPLCQKQFINTIFKQFIMMMTCQGFFMSFQVQSSNQQLVVQISKSNQQLLTKFRGNDRFTSNYWRLQEIKKTQYKQKRVFSLEKNITAIGKLINESSLFGSWKASNNIITKLFENLL